MFTAAKGYVGDVRVRLTYQGQDVGSASVTIAEPDQVYFSGKSLSLDYEKTSNLGLTVKSSLRDIHYHDGDFTWSIRPLTEGTTAADIGTIVDNRLHTAAKASQTRKAEITVTYTKANGQELTDTVTVEIGKMPTVLLDFEDESSKSGVNVGANAVWGNLNSFSGHSAHNLPGVSDAGFGVAGQVSKDPNGLDIPTGPLPISAWHAPTLSAATRNGTATPPAHPIAGTAPRTPLPCSAPWAMSTMWAPSPPPRRARGICMPAA